MKTLARTTIGPWLYTGLVTGIIFLTMFSWNNDDPFITYRYARNLVHGSGFIYNPGQQVLSTTTPLFTILLAGLSFLWSDIPHLANLVGALSLALGGILLWNLACSWGAPVVGWIGLILYPFFPLTLATVGSEMPLYLAFCLACFACYGRQSYSLSAIFAALATLTRPDGILVAVLLAVHYLVKIKRPLPWKAALLFLGMALPWFIFAWGYFGSPVPATLVAKQQQGAMAISQRFAPGFLTTIGPYTNQWQFWFAVGLASIGVLYATWRAQRWLLFLAWSALYFSAYTLLGVSRYSWYYAPLAPGFVAAIGLGVAAIVQAWQHVGQRWQVSQPWSARLTHILLVLLMIPLLLSEIRLLQALHGQSDPRFAIYRAVGEWLRESTPAEASVGVLEVGMVGYYAERTMFDFTGLLQPETSAQFRSDTTYQDAALWVVEHFHPDYVVLHDNWSVDLEEGYLARNCQLVHSFPAENYGYDSTLHVYACGVKQNPGVGFHSELNAVFCTALV